VMGMLERLAKKHDLLLSLRQIATKGESK